MLRRLLNDHAGLETTEYIILTMILLALVASALVAIFNTLQIKLNAVNASL